MTIIKKSIMRATVVIFCSTKEVVLITNRHDVEPQQKFIDIHRIKPPFYLA